jgi:hypothetical protein
VELFRDNNEIACVCKGPSNQVLKVI